MSDVGQTKRERRRRETNVNGFLILQKLFFEIVKLTGFRIHDVDHDVPKVNNNPVCFLSAVHRKQLEPVVRHIFLDDLIVLFDLSERDKRLSVG